MGEIGFQEASGLVLEEIGGLLAQVEESSVAAFGDALVGARGIFVTGEGRSGLVGRCFAMRLMHLGLKSYVVGETVTPAAGNGDLLVAISRSGESETTCARASTAARSGARVAALTAAPNSTLARGAQLTVVIPAGGAESGSAQYGGSLFEQSLLVLLDAVALQLQRRLGRTAEEMAARHATVE